jgi:ribonuclease-3
MYQIQQLLKAFNIRAKNFSLYEQAFTHTSYAHDHKSTKDYEKLEFLGDSVIQLIISEHLMQKHPQMDEGTLSRQRIIMVQSKTLIKASIQLRLPELIKFGDAIKDKKNFSDYIKEDVFESFIGALYLDQGLEICRNVLKRTVIHMYEIHSLNEMRDFKSMLQEYMQKFSKHDIVYKTVNNQNGDY